MAIGYDEQVRDSMISMAKEAGVKFNS
jgi:hypothetical protein